MERETTIATPGLITDPGPFAAPQGALFEAENVVIPRPGNIQPRGRITWYPDTTAAGNVTYHTALWGGFVYNWYNSATFPVRRNAVQSITGPTSLTQGKTWSAATADRLLFTSDQGVYSIDSASATTARRAGLPRGIPPIWTLGTTTGTWLATNYATAYRVCFARIVNTSTIVSAPSEYTVVRNNSGSTSNVALTIWLPSEIVAGDYVQIYRASAKVTPYTANPADEMRLMVNHLVTSGDIASGAVLYSDYLDDGSWNGPSLYSNEGQEGAINANYRPMYATDVAYYNGMTFYAGHKSTQQVVLQLASMGVTASPSISIQLKTITGDITAGSPTITGLSAADMAFVAASQYVTRSTGAPESADAYFAANTKVQSFNTGAGTVTLTANALATQVGASIKLWDWVAIYDGSTERRIYASDTGSVAKQFDSTATNGCASSASGAYAGSYGSSGFYIHVDGTSSTGYTWTFERTSYSTTSFTVRSTKPLAWDRYVDATTGITSTQDGGDYRLAYSKNLEPESVPLLNFDDIGSSSNVVYRVMKLRDSLFIFTAEGLYRATGTSPETLSIEQFDPTCLLWDRRLLATSHDQIWAFVQNGPVSITDGGVQSISDGVRRMFDQMWDLASGASSSSTLQPWVFADQNHGVVVFGARQTVGTVGSNFKWRGYVYNINTGAWTTWSNERTDRVIYSAVGNYPIFGSSTGFGVYSFTENSPTVGDVSYGVSATVASTSGTTVTINAGSGWTPTVGDSFSESSDLYTIVSVASATQFTTDRATGYSPGATINPIEGVESRVKWQAKAFGDPTLMKRYANAWLAFERFYRGYDMTLTWESYNNTTYLGSGNEKTDTFTIASLTEMSAYTPASAEIPLEIMRDVPSEIAEDWAIRFGFKIKRASNFWTLAAMSMSYDHLSDRVGHR